ncbi:proteasome endopeptidase complex, putative [Trichomonas vaginalis G3]|uniref:Proteasome endopeptidase complex, putative n=1 Tax=Trichomonas vaginalis (strain ATCC PRA-98 / G3) TaxID=412133 RepID=A2F7I0_TRIV3|nr:26S proteasome regulatory subunit family [Trichomonas vaginalis G3]EAX99138.1 proteasome endopeptidase complex, putative [Trichomonas vaginalis G3]KAI5549190.1 26S proteasome regulatory subunit family [Trichomonas vaginalis G3]|eukprot:XP_001312068.1 proteasome endopeptidase complex [Trichomonas vaginalis G3]
MSTTTKHETLMKRYKKLLLDFQKTQASVKQLHDQINAKRQEHQETERQYNSLQAVGQIVGEVLRPLDDERYIVKTVSGTRYVVGVRTRLDHSLLTNGRRVALDIATHTIMYALPREVDPSVYHMSTEDPGKVNYSDIGGLGDQLNEIREIIELPIVNPGIFERVGIPAPKGALLYGPPGTGKTLIARAIAANTNAKFLKVVAASLFDRYVGESARIVREMFNYARDNEPCIIFIDEIDALGGKRLEEGSSTDREVQRTLMELLAQMDGFSSTSKVKVIMATNRPDILDPALLRPGRLDRKIEIPLPNEQSRLEIIKIHSKGLNIQGEVDYDAIVKLSEGFNGADLRNVCTEAGLFALRETRDHVINEDFMKAVRTVKQTKGMESTLHYDKV